LSGKTNLLGTEKTEISKLKAASHFACCRTPKRKRERKG
jgi:hypothetical protein